MLPLNVHNVASVFRTANLTNFAIGPDIPHDKHTILAIGLGIPRDKCINPLTAAEWWMRKNNQDRSWRSIIWNLDYLEETELADELMPYSEPPSGV